MLKQCMIIKTLFAVVILSSAVPLFAVSYYTARLDDDRAIYLTPDRFAVKGDGIADDSTVLQQAISAVQEKTNQGILFGPTGRYRLTKTIFVWPGIRLIGFGRTRPTFVLAANTPGFQQGPACMMFFVGARLNASDPPPDANPGTFYSAISNIDMEMKEGNLGAVRVRAAGQVFVYKSPGDLIDTIESSERPSQLLFEGRDGRTLFVMARSCLFAVQPTNEGR